MASHNGHITDRDREAVERGVDESGPRPQPMPAPVEALILFGYPPDLVLSTYQQLQSAHATDAQHTTSVSGSGNAAMTGNALPRAMSAATLLAAVDDTIGDPDVSSSGTVGAGSGDATSPGPGEVVGAAQGLRVEEGVTTSGEVVRGHTAEDVPSTAHGSPGPGHQPSASRSAPHSTPSSNMSFINNESSANSQSSTNDQSSVNNAEEAVSSTETSSCPRASSAVQQTPETASSWTPSRTAEGPVDTCPVTTSSLVTSSVTASSHVETSPASVAERSAGTAADPHQNTPPAPSPSSGSSVVSRDRSRDREEQKEAEADEEKVRERRRQLSRLRALRAENRRLKERQTCRHCGQKPVALTLLPCGHFCLCEDCGPSFEQCPVCRKTILADVKTFVC